MLKKVHKSTLDFINKNIQTNANSSSYPVRRQAEEKIISASAVTPINLNTAVEHKD
ncbi:hypothetical protein [Colwellia sp. MB02u-9]|uniref:hypothetical protein n=1 Tax=Colwellia sp. MB02u-9 TaxID=2759823 RepID=UPI0015F5D6C4|nr:hypothetical protein [Colwellia sp. MB02u-9]MBA6295829.1 hypothetical protein [Colwellia sp. MB02u-9]